MSLTIEANEIADGLMLVVGGDVDMESSPRLRDEIKKALKQKMGKLKLKLTDVSYIDSSGIAVLIEGMKWSQKKKVEFFLVAISDSVRDVLQMSKLLRVFQVEED
ncbi:MAG: STAS domain-containing protein [Planctomycetes bacterium]|nr:STAS domain-containing protein [Planctomycetota bacterium]